MASEAQRAMFNPVGDFGLGQDTEAVGTLMREWYRIGQRLFRGHNYADETEALNDFLADVPEGKKRDGFLMGWNSDSYALSNNMQLSVEGTDRFAPEEKGYDDTAERFNVLVQSDIA